MDTELEGRPLDLSDVLLLQTNDHAERVKVTVWEVQTWWSDGPVLEAWYTLKENQRSAHGFVTHRLSLAEIKERCIREPGNRERRKGERRTATS